MKLAFFQNSTHFAHASWKPSKKAIDSRPEHDHPRVRAGVNVSVQEFETCSDLWHHRRGLGRSQLSSFAPLAQSSPKRVVTKWFWDGEGIDTLFPADMFRQLLRVKRTTVPALVARNSEPSATLRPSKIGVESSSYSLNDSPVLALTSCSIAPRSPFKIAS